MDTPERKRVRVDEHMYLGGKEWPATTVVLYMVGQKAVSYFGNP